MYTLGPALMLYRLAIVTALRNGPAPVPSLDPQRAPEPMLGSFNPAGSPSDFVACWPVCSERDRCCFDSGTTTRRLVWRDWSTPVLLWHGMRAEQSASHRTADLNPESSPP